MRNTTAPGARPTNGARRKRDRRLSGARETTDGDHARLAVVQQAVRQRKVSRADCRDSLTALESRCRLAAVALVLARTAARHDRNRGNSEGTPQSPLSPRQPFSNALACREPASPEYP